MSSERSIPTENIPRTDAAPVIDGVIESEAWENAAWIEQLTQVLPDTGAAPTEETRIGLMFDATYLYIAIRCLDRSPEEIQAFQLRRDASLGTDDHVAIIIDPFFDRRNAYYFEINPLGAIGDALIEDNTRFRKDWDGIWEGASSIDESGWSAEIAIPLQTISFNPDTDRWSFNARRFLRRRNESNRWASPSPDYSFNSVADAGIIEGLEDLDEASGVDVKPYGLIGAKRDHADNRNGFDVDAGLDIFYRPGPSFTLAMTLNTDFAEAEVDQRRVNLTRFPLFFPEKRDFFLQDAGIFNFGGIGRNPLPFHSRRIGIGPDGKPVDILAGVKLTGRTDDVNIGLLDVQMQHDESLGNKNLFVGRASVNVLDQSTIGLIATAGDPTTPGSNFVGGLDFNYRTTTYHENQTIEAHAWLLRSETPRSTEGQWAWGLKLGAPNDRIDWRIGFTEIQEDFNAALGFVPRRGIHEYFGNWRYRWRPESDFIRTIDSGLGTFLVTNLHDDIESHSVNLNLLNVTTEDGDFASLNWSRQREVLADPFEISSGIVLPTDDYRFDRYTARVRTSTGRPVNAGATYSGGTFYSGHRNDYSMDVAWRTSPNLHLGADFTINDIDLDEGSFITRIIRGRVNVFFSPDLSWTTFAQYDSVSDSMGINSRVHWIIEPGNEMFVVINQSIDREGDSFRVQQTELTTKLGWTFRF